MSEAVGLGGAGHQGSVAKDATIDSFEEDVLAASAQVPVIVDFWADWCGPCKQLAPVLEKAVAAANGKVKLVKVDIDKNQMLASQLRIQSIPTVYAFYQGRPVDGFQGAVPESEIKAFIDRLTSLGGDQAGAADAGIEDYVNAGKAAFDEGDVSAAAQLFGQALQMEPGNLGAITGLARCHLSMGDMEKAKQTLDLAPPESENDASVASIKAAIELAEAGQSGAGDLNALQNASDAAPDDITARYALAEGLIAAGKLEDAIDALLAVIERDREWEDQAARKKLLTVFDALGGGHAATIRGRRRLSSILFS